MLTPRTLLGFAGIVSLSIAANLLLKLGAAAPPAERVLFGVLGWKSLAGLALFGCGGVLYATLLRAIPLNIAQSFIAAQFIGVVGAADLLLGEPIAPVRWAGIVLICLGIFVVGLTAGA